MRVAWRELAALWQLQIPEGEPCAAAAAQHLLCHRGANLSLPALRQLGRPGILTLQSDHGAPVYALLVGLGEQSAILEMADGPHEVRNASLGRVWRGDFATYWRPPPGYAPDLPDGASGPAIERLAGKLDLLEGKTGRASDSTAPVLDAALRARVRAFQRAQGLKPDGQPGPMTFMQLDGAAGTSQPRLQSGAR
jgi:general secretion pathway protein A